MTGCVLEEMNQYRIRRSSDGISFPNLQFIGLNYRITCSRLTVLTDGERLA